MRRCIPCAILHSCGEAEATLKRLAYCVARQSQPERESRLVHLHLWRNMASERFVRLALHCPQVRGAPNAFEMYRLLDHRRSREVSAGWLLKPSMQRSRQESWWPLFRLLGVWKHVVALAAVGRTETIKLLWGSHLKMLY
jgi:hypothetical protein